MAEYLHRIEGNYDGCIAAAALSFGEHMGDAGVVHDRLKIIAQACTEMGRDSADEPCLLAPVAAGVGVVALESAIGRRILARDIRTVAGVAYPPKLGDYPVAEAHYRWPHCYRYQEPEVLAVVGDGYHAGLNFHHHQKLRSLVATTVFGQPWPVLSECHGASPTVESDKPLHTLSRVTCSGLHIDHDRDGHRQMGSPKMALWVGDGSITLTELLDGLIFSERPSGALRADYGPTPSDISKGAVVLHWPRLRTFTWALDDAMSAKFTKPWNRYFPSEE